MGAFSAKMVYKRVRPIRGGSAREGYLFHASGDKRVGIAQVGVYKRVGKSVI